MNFYTLLPTSFYPFLDTFPVSGYEYLENGYIFLLSDRQISQEIFCTQNQINQTILRGWNNLNLIYLGMTSLFGGVGWTFSIYAIYFLNLILIVLDLFSPNMQSFICPFCRYDHLSIV